MTIDRISVVIPCKDRPTQLRRALISVATQTLLPSEVIVVDDGSEVPITVGDRYPFPIQVIRHSNRGPSASRNRGIHTATSDWIALLDSDDTWMPDKLAAQVQSLEHYPEAGFCVCHREQVGWTGFSFVLVPPNGTEAGLVEDALDQIVQDCCVPTSGVLFRKDVFLRVGGFDELLWYGEDWDLWLRLAAATPVVATTQRLTVYYREEGSLFDNVARGDPTVVLEKDIYVLGKVLECDLFDPATKAKAAVRLQKAAQNLAYFYRRIGRPWRCCHAALWSLRSGGSLRPLWKHFFYCWPQSLRTLPRWLRPQGARKGEPRTGPVRRRILSDRTAVLARELLCNCP